ncbi:MAG: DUF58 domain-containing protein [Chromatiaceae bacterium]|jgi:uncharacterized protein (DUF58 family)
MDWTKIRRQVPAADRPRGAYANLDDLIRIRDKARDFSFRPQQPVTSVLSGRYASRLRGRGLNFEELRRYLPGDDVRSMDWKVTARTRTPHVRVFTEEKERAVLLVVDQRLNMFFGTRERMKSVTAAELAALAAWRTLDVGDRVGAVIFNDSEVVDIRPQRSQQCVMSILNSVVRMNHSLRLKAGTLSDPGRLNEALTSAVRLAPHDVLVVVISDFFGADEKTDRLTSQLAAHNDVLGLLVHDPVRLEPVAHSINVSDGERQMPLNLANPKVRALIATDYREEQLRIARHLRRLSAPLLLVSTEGDTVDQVRRLLGVPARVA